MDTIRDAHYYLLPTQGNVYTLTNISQNNGVNKILFATLRRKVYLLEYTDNLDGCLKPTVREILFTYIPNGAEIISLDAYNKSSISDDFFVGITIIKPNADHSSETFLNIYSEQDVDSNSVLNMESLAQNCLSIDLNFVPFQLYHTELIQNNEEEEEATKELVWLLSGSDVKIHLFREDKSSHSFSDSDIESHFPELKSPPSVVMWIDILHVDDYKRRITAFGCECGLMKFAVVDVLTNTISSIHNNQFEGPISQVKFFNLTECISYPELLNVVFEKSELEKSDLIETSPDELHLVVTSVLQMSAVYMNVIENGLSDRHNLEESECFDATLCVCPADIDMDGEKEIIIGTYAQELMMYKYIDNRWLLQTCRSLEHPIHSLEYTDVTGDGAKELIVLTLGGLHVMQHSQDVMYNKFITRIKNIINYRRDMNDKSEVDESGESYDCPEVQKFLEDKQETDNGN